MFRTITVVAAMLILFSAAAVQTQEAEVSIRGQIVDSATGEAISGSATVFMNHDGSLLSDNATAAEDGTFTLEVPVAPRRMLVWAENYAPREIVDFEEVEEGYIIDLDPLQDMTIQLVREDGTTPMAGTSVRVQYGERGDNYLPDWLTRSLEEQLITTDPNGIFVVHDVVPFAEVRVLLQADDQFGESRLRIPQVRPEHTNAPRQDLGFETQVRTRLVAVVTR